MNLNPFNIFTKRETGRTFKKSYTTYNLMRAGLKPAKFTDYSLASASRNGFKKSTWLFACVKLRADNISSVDWQVEQRVGDEWEPNPRHELQALIDNPNESFGWKDIIRMSVYQRDLCGDFYSTIIRNTAGRIVEVWPLIPDRMEITAGLTSLISKYKYYKGSVTKDLWPEEVLHLKYTSADNLYYGMPPLQACARAIDIDEEAEKWQKAMLENMAIPSGLLTFENIDQKQYDASKKWLSEQLDESDRGRPLVVGNGKWQSMGQTATELAFIQSRKMIREEICSAYSVQPVMIGILDNATLANIEIGKKILWQEGLLPVISETENQINRQLVKDPNVRIKADLSKIAALQESYTDKLASAKIMFDMSIPFSQINQRLGLGVNTDLMPNADTGYLPSGLLPADMDFDEFIQGGDKPAEEAYGK
jgi:HK97 family phage portal protein